jgi:hypothetical protein
VLAFSRTKGHGFLKPVDKEGYQEFFHVSDVTSEVNISITVFAGPFMPLFIFGYFGCYFLFILCTVVFGQADTSLSGQNLRIFSENPV